MSIIKTYKRGEVLYREGEKALNLYFIQSGQVGLQLSRQKQTIELCVLGTNQLIGEHGLAGVVSHPHSAIALNEVKAVEMSIEMVRAQSDTGSQLSKLLIKSFAEKSKVVMKEFTSMKLERDNTPCPPDQTAKIFGALYYAARSKGETASDKSVRIDVRLMKKYAQRIFVESPKRLETAMNIFAKLKIARYEYAKPEDDPQAPEELAYVTFSSLEPIEEFFEYFQYYYFKGGKTELLKTDDRVMLLASMLTDLATAGVADRRGAVRIEYTTIIEKYRELTGLNLNNDHFTAMETKGLYVKRQSEERGVFLSFDLNEFSRTNRIWKILREVERWNEKGSVDPNEVVSDVVRKKATCECPTCKKGYEVQPKFCMECGYKFVAAA